MGILATAHKVGLDLGIIKIQPSEIMRIAVPMMLAWFFAKREASPRIADFAIASHSITYSCRFNYETTRFRHRTIN